MAAHGGSALLAGGCLASDGCVGSATKQPGRRAGCVALCCSSLLLCV